MMKTDPHRAERRLLAARSPAPPLAGEPGVPREKHPMILPYMAGGSSDLLGRAVAKRLGDTWGRKSSSKPAGRERNDRRRVVAKAPPDGYTLLSTTSSYPGTVAVRAKLPFDPSHVVRDRSR